MPRRIKAAEAPSFSGKRWNIALYIRLSREDGNDESLSVTNQKKILAGFVEGMDGRCQIIDSYVDDGLSGTDYERPAFRRMMKDIEDGRVNCVIVKDLARAFRNYSDQGYFLETFFPTHNTRFITVGSPRIDSHLDPESVSGFDVPITGVMNDRYCKKTSDDVRRTFDMKRRNGEFIGAFAPYGYAKSPADKNMLVIDDEAADVVRDIFSWYVNEGCSKMGIAKRLSSMGIPNPTAYKKSKGLKYQSPNARKNDGMWSPCTIRAMLSNKMYIGCMVQGRYRIKSYKVHTQIKLPESEWFTVPGTHEAIIDENTFEKAQELQKRDMRAAPDKHKVYLFSGFIRCADCKKSMTRKTSKGNVYYSCRTYREKDKCTKHSINLKTLEKAVLIVLQKQIELMGSMAELIEKINACTASETQYDRLNLLLEAREKELSRAEELSDGLYIDWKSGDITKDDYHRMKDRFEKQAAQIKEAMLNIKEEMDTLENGAPNPYPAHLQRLGNIETLDRGLLAELVRTIYVHEGGEITIEFNFADQYRSVLKHLECARDDTGCA